MFFAAPPTIDIRSQASDITKMTRFEPALENGLRVLLFIGALLTFGYLIWGGFDWILSQGDSGKVEAARKKITHAIIGLMLLASAAAIFFLVQSFLGIDVLKNTP